MHTYVRKHAKYRGVQVGRQVFSHAAENAGPQATRAAV